VSRRNGRQHRREGKLRRAAGETQINNESLSGGGKLNPLEDSFFLLPGTGREDRLLVKQLMYSEVRLWGPVDESVGGGKILRSRQPHQGSVEKKAGEGVSQYRE